MIPVLIYLLGIIVGGIVGYGARLAWQDYSTRIKNGSRKRMQKRQRNAFIFFLIILLFGGIMASGVYYNSSIPKVPIINQILPISKNDIKNTNVSKTNSKTTKDYNLYFFHQPDCPYCVIQEPIVTTWANNKTHITYYSIDVTTDSSYNNKYAIRTVPLTVLVDKSTGQEVHRWLGTFDISELNKYYIANP